MSELQQPEGGEQPFHRLPLALSDIRTTGFAVRFSTVRYRPSPSIASRSTFVTIAKRPLWRSGIAEVVGLIWAENEAEYLCRHDWTGQISLIRQEKFDFRRGAIEPLRPAVLRSHRAVRHSGQSQTRLRRRDGLRLRTPGDHASGYRKGLG